MNRFIWLLLLLPTLAWGQTVPDRAIPGWCNAGATNAKTSGMSSTNALQGIIPNCRVTVFLTGTTTLATIHSDAFNTPLSNPFTATSSGQWTFWAQPSVAYDIVLSGGIPPNTYSSPVTLTAVQVGGPGSGGPTAPGGNANEIQFNGNGFFVGTTGMTWDAGTNTLNNSGGTMRTNFLYANGGAVASAAIAFPSATCTNGSQVYSPAINGCITNGTANNPAGTSGQLQYNNGGVFGAVPGVTFDGSGNFNFPGTIASGTVSAPSVNGVTYTGTGSSQSVVFPGTVSASNAAVNGFTLGYQQPLIQMARGPMVSKTVMLSGDSTTALAVGAYISLCSRTQPGQELAGLLCAVNSTYSIDGSKNVTVVVTGNLPVNCTVGSYVTIDGSSTFAQNALPTGGPGITFQITSTTSNSFTYNNPNAVANIASSAANGVSTCSILNNGSNGQTQSGFNSATGVGSLAFTNSISPDIDIHSMGINDVRLGAVNQSTLQGYYKTYIDSVRANSPKTMIVLVTPNNVMAVDPTTAGWITSPSTTSSTAIAGAGSATITLAAQLNAINGLVTPDMTLAQQVANTQAVTVAATTGSGTGGNSAVTLASGNGFYNGMLITIAGGGSTNNLYQIQSGGGTTSITVAPPLVNTVSGAAVAQSATVGSGYLLVDSGASQEIVSITAISGNTVTATFAAAHSGTYTVIPTMATMAQAYSNIWYNATMSFVGYAPNVLVADTQTNVFGRLVKDVGTLMANQLHPTYMGYDARSVFEASTINKAMLSGSATASLRLPALSTFRYSSVVGYSPFLAKQAMDANYSSCWANGYYQCVENPDYFTLLGSGTLIGYSSGSYVTVNNETDTFVSNALFGVFPCGRFDVVEIVGYLSLGAVTSCTNFSGATQISTSAAIPAGIPNATPVRVYRPNYYDPAAEYYVKSPLLYPYHRRLWIQGAGNGYLDLVTLNPPENNANLPADNVVTADVLVVQGYGIVACTSFTLFGNSTSLLQCNKSGTDFTAYGGNVAWLFGNHQPGQTMSTTQEILNNGEYSYSTCTTAATINPTNGNNQRLPLTNGSACALTFTQPSQYTSAVIQLKIAQSTTGSFNGTITGCKWPGGTVPTITATSGAVDIFRVYLDGANAYCSVIGQNMQ